MATSLYIDEPAGYPNVAVRDDIAQVAADYGLAMGDGAPVLNGEVPPGTIRVIASRSSASVPGCPDWARTGRSRSAELTSSSPRLRDERQPGGDGRQSRRSCRRPEWLERRQRNHRDPRGRGLPPGPADRLTAASHHLHYDG
jgi:hypothetical protein